MTIGEVNIINLTKSDYQGKKSTLCEGCGHNAISHQIITACYELGLQPEKLAKFSGIGCSSKCPAYFLNRSHGFNTLHGRMPSVATGALMVNHTLLGIGMSGDGDTASIGLGQFKHLLRRNVPMVYIVANNGVYGLTKGQFSMTADIGQTSKYAGHNELPPIDLMLEAIIGGCGFVARSFAGDRKQMILLLKAAFSYNGTAVLDVISPCVAFNNHDESTKSYSWSKAHNEPLHDINYVTSQNQINLDYEPGEDITVGLHHGSQIILKKLERDYDPTNREAAIHLLQSASAKHLFITGLIYYQTRSSLRDLEHLPETPLVALPADKLRPTRQSLEKLIMELPQGSIFGLKRK